MGRRQRQRKVKKKGKKMEDPDVKIIPLIAIEEEEVNLRIPILCKGDNNDPISVEPHTDYVQLQQAIFISTHRHNKTRKRTMKKTEDHQLFIGKQCHAPVINLTDEEPLTPSHKTSRKRPFTKHSITETGEPSNQKRKPETIFCQICMEPKQTIEAFTIKGCSHVFCLDCIRRHITATIQENSPTVRCPDLNCEGVIEPEFCSQILRRKVFERWGSILCESSIVGSMRFYCPFKDCSALLVDERGGIESVIAESECPHCHRLFCAQCKVPWHSGASCEEFQKLNENEREREDLMLMDLAKKSKWQRCPKCGYCVDKLSGCQLMTCRCGERFCYNCGGQMISYSHICIR